MSHLLPRLRLELADPLQGLGQHRWLEIGFGGGEHLANLAAHRPDVSLVGAEAFLNGVAKLLALVAEKNLQNVHIHYGDARELLAVLPDGVFERVYLLYPDPWPKERQKKRRFVNPANLESLHRVLSQGGLFHFVSDIADYVEWTAAHVASHGGFELVSHSEAPYPLWTQTRYEAKALREGRKPAYLVFKRR